MTFSKAVLSLALLLFAPVPLVLAQGSLPLGTIPSVNMLARCHPDASGSLPFEAPVDLGSTACYEAVVDCSNVDSTLAPLQVYIAVSTPFVTPTGTIFLHGGSDGTQYFNDGIPGVGGYAELYFMANFQVVQIAWFPPGWHASGGVGSGESTKNQACRPATLMNYVNTQYHAGVSGGMCAQGHSGGSAAVAYALGWYGASSYLDNVLLTSGPVFSDINQGCSYPPTPYTNPITVVPTVGTSLGTSWTDFTQYVERTVGGEREFAARTIAADTIRGSNCADYRKTQMHTSPSQNSTWKQMSILDDSKAVDLNYPNTSLSAFLCAPDDQSGYPQNNSAAQGYLFLQLFPPLGTLGVAKNFNVFRVDQCSGDEMIWSGTTGFIAGTGSSDAFTNSRYEMTNYCVNNH